MNRDALASVLSQFLASEFNRAIWDMVMSSRSPLLAAELLIRLVELSEKDVSVEPHQSNSEEKDSSSANNP